jgi:hypothetical protein
MATVFGSSTGYPIVKMDPLLYAWMAATITTFMGYYIV